MVAPEVGVFLSTTRIKDPTEACAAVASLGFRVVQLGKLPDECYTPAGNEVVREALRRNGLGAASLCVVFDGERYDSVESVSTTVGFLPAEPLEGRLAYTRRCIDTAAALGIPLVTFHMGMLPASPSSEAYRRVQRAVDEVGAYAAKRDVAIGLETGQESAAELLAFLDRLSAPVRVNYDGGNFVAYGTDDPLDALTALSPKLEGVHIKDRRPPERPGLVGPGWRLGQGTAKVDETLQLLMELGWSKPIILETYAVKGDDPIETLTHARAYVLERLEKLDRAPVHA
ncbi:MAG TPA: sugar phosphate isomerase/epimerase family protein [Chloroflexota bacterium]|nr:sugar phosphate isomerase/epimerase family protein [Chloroflexota bacterium]